MKSATFGFIFLSLAIAFSMPATAKTFSNSYVSFELPEDWNCGQEGPSWVCTPKLAKDARETLIVINAKVAGPEDNLTNFKSYLSKPRTIAAKGGTPITSKVILAEEVTIAGQPWVRAQHLSSEVPDFYTLYLVTTKAQLAILLSFSAEKSKATQFNSVFDKAVRSLRIVASRELLVPKLPNGSTSETIGIQVEPSQNPANLQVPPAPKTKKSMPLMVILGFLGVAGLAVYYWLTRK